MATSKGNELYQLFVELTGLSTGTVEEELQSHMKRLEMDPETLTTDDIRKLMAIYLDEFNSGLTSTFEVMDMPSDAPGDLPPQKISTKAEA